MERYDLLSLQFGVISAFWSRCWRVLIQLFIDMGPNNTYPCVFNMKRRTYPHILVGLYDASQFEMINFTNVKIEHFNSDLDISLFGNIPITSIYGRWRHMRE